MNCWLAQKPNTANKVSLRYFSKANLNWKRDRYPEVRCKGADTMVISQWLVSLDLSYSPWIATLVWAADAWVHTIMGCAQPFHSSEEVSHILGCGALYFQCYVSLAQAALSCRPSVMLWKLRPKFHLCCHVVYDLARKKSRRCPHLDSCWMDEDYVKRIMGINSRCCSRTNAT
jgi:hypothetical protein